MRTLLVAVLLVTTSAIALGETKPDKDKTSNSNSSNSNVSRSTEPARGNSNSGGGGNNQSQSNVQRDTAKVKERVESNTVDARGLPGRTREQAEKYINAPSKYDRSTPNKEPPSPKVKPQPHQ